MEELYSGTDCRSRCDSTMMEVLRSAIDSAHEKVRPEDGPIEFLNKMTKFYALAVVLVEGGFSIVREATEIPESRREKILSDVMEMRRRLYERVEVVQMLVAEKDRELMDRIENEVKLRQDLGMKEKELALLREKVKNIERTKGDEEIEEGEITEWECSVDRRDSSSKHKSEGADLDSEDELYSKGRNSLSLEREKIILQMNSDLENLKSLTLLHNAKRKSNRERKSDIEYGLSEEKLFELVTEMKMLREELYVFSSRDSFQMRSLNENDVLGPLTNICRSVSDPLPEVALYQSGEDKRTEGRSRYVAEMIKSHEAIIRRQHKESSSLAGEKSPGKESSSLDTNIRSDHLEKMIQECISKLDSLISWNHRLVDELEDSCLQSSMTEEVYLLLFQCLSKDVNAELSKIEGDETEFLEYILREDIHNIFIAEMINSLKQFKDDYEMENLIREDIHDLVMIEAVKDAIFLSREAEEQEHLSLSSLPSTARKLDSEGEESLIQVLDSVLKCLEMEEDLVLSASSEIEQHSVNHYLEIFRTEEREEREAIQWLLDADQSILSSVNLKLTKALKQLLASKELLMDLEQGLGLYDNGDENNNNYNNNNNNNVADIVIRGDYVSENPDSPNNAFLTLGRFQQVLTNFEDTILVRLEKNCLRIKKLEQQLHELADPVASLRKRKQLYKKAFTARCHNLRLAETEVDLLGDQVDALVQFLEKIYLKLSKNSPAFSCRLNVSNVVRSIKKELDAVAHTTRINA